MLLTNLVLTLQSNQPGTLAAAAVEMGADRPLDVPVVITGNHNQGEPYDFTHSLGPNPESIQPCKVYDQGGGTLKGVGRYCSDFGSGTVPGGIFGDGRDGALTIAANLTDNPIDSACSGTVGTHTLLATNPSFATGQAILIHQSQGTNAGKWMRNRIASYDAGLITLEIPLNATYTAGAQVLVLKQHTNVTVNTGKTRTAKAWNGTTGGILAFVANGEVAVKAESINIPRAVRRLQGRRSHQCKSL